MSQTAAYIAQKAENAAYISQILSSLMQYMPRLKTATNAQSRSQETYKQIANMD